MVPVSKNSAATAEQKDAYAEASAMNSALEKLNKQCADPVQKVCFIVLHSIDKTSLKSTKCGNFVLNIYLIGMDLFFQTEINRDGRHNRNHANYCKASCFNLCDLFRGLFHWLFEYDHRK